LAVVAVAVTLAALLASVQVLGRPVAAALAAAKGENLLEGAVLAGLEEVLVQLEPPEACTTGKTARIHTLSVAVAVAVASSPAVVERAALRRELVLAAARAAAAAP
jgi:hypothetical protein